MFIQVDTRKTRAYTVALMDMVEQGVVDKDALIQDLLNYMSEHQVQDFAESNGYIDTDEGDDE